MKKILFALLAVSMVLPVSAMADNTTIYGQFRYSVAEVEDNSGIDGITTRDNVSLLGVKGSYGEGVKAYFHLQMGANADVDGGHDHWYNDDDSAIGGANEDRDTSKGGNSALKQRFYFAGLKGAFGNVKYGRLSNSYKMVGFKMDPLYNTSHIGVDGNYTTGLATYGLSKLNNGFTDNSIEYTSPKIGGVLTFNLGVYLDDGNEDDHGMGAGLKVKTGGVTAGVQMLSNDDTHGPNKLDADATAVRLHAAYKGGNFSVAASFETVEENVATTDDEPTYIFVVGKFNVTDATQLVATYGTVDDESKVEGAGVTFSVFQDVTTNTKVFASYAMADLDNGVTFKNEDSPSAITIGVQHKFSTSN